VQDDFNLEDAFEQLIELWEGVCDIDIIVNPQLAIELTKDLDAAHCVNEFVKECANNAIKHGRATEIDVHVAPLSETRIDVRVSNNGEYLAENQAGLGTRILDEITTTWNRERTPAGTLVTGTIALIPSLASQSAE
jgi:signal transduction histidine kinase